MAIEVILGKHAYKMLASARGFAQVRKPYSEILSMLNERYNSGRIYDSTHGKALYVDNLSGYFPINLDDRDNTKYFTATWKNSLFSKHRGVPLMVELIKWQPLADKDLVRKLNSV